MLKAEGYEVVLTNSNPATIMADPEIAHQTYSEPVTADMVAAIIAKERPDALVPALGGQTGLNTAIKVHRMGLLDTKGSASCSCCDRKRWFTCGVGCLMELVSIVGWTGPSPFFHHSHMQMEARHDRAKYPKKIVLGDITVRDGLQHEEKYIPLDANAHDSGMKVCGTFSTIRSERHT